MSTYAYAKAKVPAAEAALEVAKKASLAAKNATKAAEKAARTARKTVPVVTGAAHSALVDAAEAKAKVLVTVAYRARYEALETVCTAMDVLHDARIKYEAARKERGDGEDDGVQPPHAP